MDKIKKITKSELKMCLGKTKHKYRLSAEDQMYAIMKDEHSETPERLNVYKCPFCGYFHVGNNNRPEKNKKAA